MPHKTQDFKIVVLNSFYDSPDDPLAQALLPRLLALKIRGYLHEYSYGALPIDTTDLIGTHYAVCEERRGELHPLTAFKAISSTKCAAHSVHFPVLTALGPEAFANHRAAIRSILDRAQQGGRDVIYNSSWTIDPEIRRADRKLTGLLRELFVAINVFYCNELPSSEFITMGLLRFKTENLFEKAFGYRPIHWAGSQLDPVRHSFLGGEPVVLMHSLRIPPAAQVLAEPFRSLWENRIVIGGPTPALQDAA